MFKRFSLLFLMVVAFCNLTMAINNPTYSQNLQRGQLNEIKLNADATFKADILGNGIEQTFTRKEAKNGISSTTIISQKDKILKVLNIPKYEFTGKWYIAYLRNNDIPDIVFYSVSGPRKFVTEFMIIGKTKTGDIDILFDLMNPPLDIAEVSYDLSINGTQLIIRGNRGDDRIAIEWDGNNFKARNLSVANNVDAHSVWQYGEGKSNGGRSVQLSIRDKYGSFNRRGCYDANFIVYAPNGKNYYYTGQGNGDSWVD